MRKTEKLLFVLGAAGMLCLGSFAPSYAEGGQAISPRQ